MANPGRGGHEPQTDKGHAAAQRGGNRGGDARPRPDPNGPGNERQSMGKDPNRGKPS